MLPELEDLERRCIFTKAEIKSIVKKRTAHEYAIHRKIAKKGDFLAYIEYETNLEKLRRKRKQRLGLNKAPEKGEKGISLSDHSMLRRIHTLYQKMLKKFKGDVRLWVQYFEWSKRMGSTKALATSFARAIQLHPTKSVFWIMAAAWEFEENSNVTAARVLMQRGLRINPVDKKMWLEYFKLELLWVQKLKERRRILFKEDIDEMAVDGDDEDAGSGADSGDDSTGPEAAGGSAGADSDEEADTVTVPKLSVESEHEPGLAEKDSSLASSRSQTSEGMLKKELTPLQKALLEVMIPRAIYRNAIKAIPGDLDFRLDFVDVYVQFGKTSAKGVEEVFQSVLADFPESPKALAKIAEQHVLFVDTPDPAFPAALKKSVAEFESLLAARPSSLLWTRYLDFLSAQRAATNEPNLIKYLDILALRGYKASEAAGMCTVGMFLDWIQRAPQKEVGAVVAKALAAHPTSSLLWLEHISRVAATVSAKKTAFETAVSKVAKPERRVMWERFCAFLVESGSSEGEIETAFKTAISPAHLGNNTADEDALKLRFLDWSLAARGIGGFRALRTALAKQKIQSPAFYAKCIDIETRQLAAETAGAGAGVKLGKAAAATADALEKLWEAAVQVDRHGLDAWIGRIRFTFDVRKDPAKAAQLYWMAAKEVHDKDELEREFQDMKQQ
nr:U3 snoRNP protein [Polyrhizophydium stewartii]